MISLRKKSLAANRRRLEEEIRDQELDYPVALETDGWTLYRLGKREDHLFLADRTDPIVMTGAEVTERYRMPFDMTLTKIVMYQTTDLGVEDNTALNIRLNLLHPNGTPEVIYSKQGISWPTGGERITGVTYMPASELQVVHNGTATYLLYVSIEVVVHNVA